jgi:hypothetical protein
MNAPERIALTFATLPPLRTDLGDGVFAGVTTLKDGTHCAVDFLHARPSKRMNFDKANGWAKEAGGQCPPPAVALMLRETVPDLLPDTWVWTDKPEGSSYAWYCYFDGGYVSYDDRSSEGGAVAVRLIPLTA